MDIGQITIIASLCLAGILFCAYYFYRRRNNSAIGPETKILLLALVLVVSCVGLGGLVFYLQGKQIFQQYEEDNIRELTDTQAAVIDRQIGDLRDDVLFLSRMPTVKAIMQAKLAAGQGVPEDARLATLRQQLANNFGNFLLSRPRYLQARFIGLSDEGREIVRVTHNNGITTQYDGTPLQSKEATDYLRATAKLNENGVYLSEVNLNREHGQIVVPHQTVLRAATPIYSTTGQVFGIVILNMNFDALIADVIKTVKKESIAYITNAAGDYLYHPDSAKRFATELGTEYRITREYPALMPVYDSANQAPVYDIHALGNGQEIRAHIHKLGFDSNNPSRYLALVNITPSAAFDRFSRPFLNKVVLILVALMAFSFVPARFFARRITQSLKQITVGSQELAAGNPALRAESDSADELNEMAAAFNVLTGQLMESLSDKDKVATQLKNKARDLEFQKFALDQHAIVSIADPAGFITYANDKFLQISQYTLDELIGRSHHLLNSGYHSREFWHEFWGSISKGKVWHGEIRNRCKDGSHYWVETSVVPFLDESGKPCQYISIRTDITATKEAELALQQSNEELELRVAKRTADLSASKEIIEQDRQALSRIMEGTAAVTGKNFFRSLVKHLAQALGVRYAFVAETIAGEVSRSSTIALWAGNDYAANFEYELSGTPCEKVVGSDYCCFPNTVSQLFPEDAILGELGIESYAGVPMLDSHGNAIGILAIMDTSPMRDQSRVMPVMQIFAARAGAEMERRRSMAVIREQAQNQDVINDLLVISFLPLSLKQQLEGVLEVVTSVPWLGVMAKGCVFLANEETQQLHMEAYLGLKEPLLSKCAAVPYGECLCGKAAQQTEEDIHSCQKTPGYYIGDRPDGKR